MTNSSIHIPVMAAEALQHLAVVPGGRYIDATLGGGSHTEAILKACAPTGSVLSLDVDRTALDRARERFQAFGKQFQTAEGNFRHIERLATDRGFAPVNGILFDLGLSSDELSDPSKGLSFMTDGPLDMRLGPCANEDGLTAANIVNSWKEGELADVIFHYGEERLARRIAAAIVAARQAESIVTTFQLRDIVAGAVSRGYEHGRIHPATRTFQALRIAVNDELEALKDALVGASRLLVPGGKLVVISFHSLEDRIVKRAFQTLEGMSASVRKPLVPSEEEMNRNPRARSAKMRVAERAAE